MHIKRALINTSYVHVQTVIQSKFNCTVAYNAAILQQIYNIRL